MADRSVSTPTQAGARGTVSTDGKSGGQTVQAGNIQWGKLTVQSTAILRQVVAPIYVDGFSTLEVAKRLELKQPAIRLLVEYFTNEVRELAKGPAD